MRPSTARGAEAPRCASLLSRLAGHHDGWWLRTAQVDGSSAEPESCAAVGGKASTAAAGCEALATTIRPVAASESSTWSARRLEKLGDVRKIQPLRSDYRVFQVESASSAGIRRLS